MSSNNSTIIDQGLSSTAFILLGSCSIFLMTPGLGFFYSGLAQTKNALSLIMICMLTFSVVFIQWFLFGFSLAFSETGSSFLGNFQFGAFTGLGIQPLLNTASQVPGILFATNQGMVAAVTCAIIFGSVAERIRLLPAMLFAFLWTTLVYDVVAYWTWSYRGWLRNLSCLNADIPCGIGFLDFGGGGPVHTAAGFSALAYCLLVGKRQGYGQKNFKPSSVGNVFLGTGLLWFGWIFFNASCANSANVRAAMAALATSLAGCAGSLAWVLLDYIKTKKLSGLAYCSGALAGLVAVTPGSGFFSP
jgi:Amt family ammonium transporter